MFSLYSSVFSFSSIKMYVWFLSSNENMPLGSDQVYCANGNQAAVICLSLFCFNIFFSVSSKELLHLRCTNLVHLSSTTCCIVGITASLLLLILFFIQPLFFLFISCFVNDFTAPSQLQQFAKLSQCLSPAMVVGICKPLLTSCSC